MTCPRCGNIVRDDAKFCTKCGFKLALAQPAPQQPEQKPIQPPVQRTEQRTPLKPIQPLTPPVLKAPEIPKAEPEVRKEPSVLRAPEMRKMMDEQELSAQIQPRETRPLQAVQPLQPLRKAETPQTVADMKWVQPDEPQQQEPQRPIQSQPPVPPQAPQRPMQSQPPVPPQAPQRPIQSQPPVPPVPPMQNPAEVPKEPKGIKKGVIIGCIAGVIVIVAAVLLIWFMGRDKDNKVDADSSNALVQQESVEQASDVEESSEESIEESSVEESSVEESSVPEVDPNEERIAAMRSEIDTLDAMDFESAYDAEEDLFEMLLENAEDNLEAEDFENAQNCIHLCNVLVDNVLNQAEIQSAEILAAEWDGNGKVKMQITVNPSAADLINEGFIISESAAGTTVFNEVSDMVVSMPEQELQYVSVDAVGKGTNNSIYDDIISACNTARENSVPYVLAYTDGQDAASGSDTETVIDAAAEMGIAVYIIGIGNNVDFAACSEIAGNTGGKYIAVADEAEMKDILSDIGNVLARTYTVEYTSIFLDDSLLNASVCVGYLGVDDYVRTTVEYKALLEVEEEQKEEQEEAKEEESQAEETADSEYIFPESGSRYLTAEEVSALSSEELRLARNEIYARKGRRFNDAGLQSYFDSKSWYEGTIAPDNFSNSMLNQYEIANIELIQSYE